MVARSADDQARSKAADADAVRSVFHLGFDVDEQLEDRLAAHKRSGVPPKEALPGLIGLEDEWVATMWAEWLDKMAIPETSYNVTLSGRQVRGADSTMPVVELVHHLVGALYAPSETYPAPHVLK